MMSELPRLHFSEDFARFLEAPSRDRLRELLRRQTGEYDFLDFKESWPEMSVIAKHVLSFANSGSGCLVIGVAERDDKTLEPKGLDHLEDKTNIKAAIKKYVPESVAYEIHDFEYSDSDYERIKGKKFQVLTVLHKPKLIPVLSLSDGSSIWRNRVYVRSNTSSTEADNDQLQKLISQRLAAEAQPMRGRELAEHLSELEALYNKASNEWLNGLTVFGRDKQNFYAFVRQMIGRKEEIIRRLIDS
jgi:predicted HTH transcriptional regulator